MTFQEFHPSISLRDAAYELALAGHSVEPSDMPGLLMVDGRELTMGQVKSLGQRARNENTARALDTLATAN